MLGLHGAHAATVPRSPAVTADAQCAQYYHDACSEAIGAWLPRLGSANDQWSRGRSKRIARLDAFRYGSSAPQHLAGLYGHFPFDGTAFAYGTAGPPKGQLVYDRVHRIAFYEQGCCSWHDVIAAADTAPPPKRVVERDLTRLSTVRGVRLGMATDAVTRIYGPAKAFALDEHPGVSVVAYDAALSLGPPSPGESPCRQFANFYFRAKRLILIQLGNWC